MGTEIAILHRKQHAAHKKMVVLWQLIAYVLFCQCTCHFLNGRDLPLGMLPHLTQPWEGPYCDEWPSWIQGGNQQTFIFLPELVDLGRCLFLDISHLTWELPEFWSMNWKGFLVSWLLNTAFDGLFGQAVSFHLRRPAPLLSTKRNRMNWPHMVTHQTQLEIQKQDGCHGPSWPPYQTDFVGPRFCTAHGQAVEMHQTTFL